ncbi:MAG: hypothetical protein [Caudoviricetes sp.]|nr:MAG: hypothetical protein [Caudoviricetes sp.]
MYGQCKNCNKLMSCHKPIGYKRGYCETDFEPKAVPENIKPIPKGMDWENLADGEWQAKGEHGDFLLWKEGRWWTGRYAANKSSKFFRLPFGSLRKIKSMCENNYNWE